jgi:L-rhamnose mutarotase
MVQEGSTGVSGTFRRVGSVIGLHPDKIDEYKKLHANVWPKVLEQIHNSNIRNYSIFLAKLDDGNYYLFSYFEYTGEDFEADMAAMAAHETTQKWWQLCKPCQRPCENRTEGEWWMNCKEVFHTD